MSVLGFYISGGSASISGDLNDELRLKLDFVVRSFAINLQKLTFESDISLYDLKLQKSNTILLAKDKTKVFFLFIESLGGNKIIYRDFSRFESVVIDDLADEIRSDLGKTIFSFTVPLEDLDDRLKFKEHAERASEDYISSYIKKQTQEFKLIQEIDEQLCFVIMSFSNNPHLEDFYYEGIKPTIEGLGYRCERVDEQEFNGSIKEQILTNITEAKFIVADVTEARPNCYYELGVAHAIGKNVIHLANETDDIHFDINDFNFIIYNRLSELKQRLKDRILSTV